jgi:hypothetical protein
MKCDLLGFSDLKPSKLNVHKDRWPSSEIIIVLASLESPELSIFCAASKIDTGNSSADAQIIFVSRFDKS